MFDELITGGFAALGGPPAFEIHGKGRRERSWRRIRVYASRHHDLTTGWPLMRGCCVTWSSEVIVIGWDQAAILIREQCRAPASREHPVFVWGGRLGDWERRKAAGAVRGPTLSEVMAHECGHTWQALALGPVYLPFVGAVTRFQEGCKPWNHFENQASEEGLFGGLIPHTLCDRLAAELPPQRRPRRL